MRLIDADKIDYIVEDEEKPSCLDYVRRSHIADEPTVEAIPIEWLLNLRNRYFEENCFMSVCIVNEILNIWSKENETSKID